MPRKIEVVVTVDENCETTVDVNGTVGRDCERYTNAITEELGGAVISEQKKPVYHEKKEKKTVRMGSR